MKHSKHEEENLFLRLSDDLLLDIMYRLPVESLGVCKVVCKSWLSIISDPDFVISHLEYSKENDLPMTLVSQKHNIISTLQFRDYTDITEGVSLVPLDYEFVDDEYDGYCFIVGSCDGLICIYLRETRKRYRDSMYIWNPVIDEEMEISLPVDEKSCYIYIDSCWFGSVSSSDDYKIFLVYSVHWQTSLYLYSFRYRRWRPIHVFDRDVEHIRRSNSVYMDEALHYLVHRKWILKFDLVAGSFEKIPFSIKPDLLPEYNRVLLGTIGEYDCLCATFMQSREEWMFELWILKEYGNWDSWGKFYRIDLQENVMRNCIQFLGFTYSGELCIQKEDGLLLIDPSYDPPKCVSPRNPSYGKAYKVMDFVESLLSPDSIP